MNTAGRSAPRAFTLIELLVVAIIAILASLSFEQVSPKGFEST